MGVIKKNLTPISMSIRCTEIDRTAKTATFTNGYASSTIHKGRAIVKIGLLNPVESKQAYKMYYAIFNPKETC